MKARAVEVRRKKAGAGGAAKPPAALAREVRRAADRPHSRLPNAVGDGRGALRCISPPLLSTSRRSRSELWRCSSAMYVSCGMVVALATIHSPAGGYWAAGSSFIGRLVLLSTGEATGVGDDQGGSGGAAARRRSFGGASRVTQTQQTTRRCVAALAALCRSSAAARRCLEVRCCYSKKSPALPSAFYRVMCVPVCV